MSGSPIMIRAQCVRAPRKFAPTWGKSVLAEQVSNTPNRTDHWATGKSTRENKVVWWKFSNDKTTCDISMYRWLISRIFLIISTKLSNGSWDGVEQSANIDHCPHCQLFQLSQKHSSSTVLSMVGAISYSTHWISTGAGKYRHWLTSSHWPSSLIHPVSNPTPRIGLFVRWSVRPEKIPHHGHMHHSSGSRIIDICIIYICIIHTYIRIKDHTYLHRGYMHHANIHWDQGS